MLRILSLIFLALLTGCASTPLSTFGKTEKPNLGAALKIDILHGKMSITGDGQPANINPTTISIPNNSCQQTKISASPNNVSRTLQTCYYGDALYFDSKKIGKGQTKGAIRFNSNPLWAQGFTYRNINSFGNAQLTDTDVRIQTQ